MQFTPKLKLPRPEPSDNHNLANHQLLIDRLEENAATLTRIPFNENKDLFTLGTGLYYLIGTEISRPQPPISGDVSHYQLDVTKGGNRTQFILRRNFDNRMWLGSIHSSDGTFRGWDEVVTDKSPQWFTLPLKNGVVPYSTVSTPQFCKIGNVVYLRGSASNIVSSNTVIATLPVGYRPSTSHAFAQNASRISGATNFARWNITTNGDIEMQHNTQNEYNAGYWYPINTNFIAER